jgi:hypothetical protein
MAIPCQDFHVIVKRVHLKADHAASREIDGLRANWCLGAQAEGKPKLDGRARKTGESFGNMHFKQYYTTKCPTIW